MDINNNITNISSCDLCGSLEMKEITSGNQEIYEYSIPVTTVQCINCKFLFQPQRYSDELLEFFYKPDTSFIFEDNPISGNKGKEIEGKVSAGLNARQAVITNALHKFEIKKGGRILDVGGGRGDICAHLVDDYQIVVSDTTPVKTIKNIKKIPKLFSSAEEHNSYDVVVLNHILEHVFSPTEALTSAKALLKENGIIIIEVPFELFTPIVYKNIGDWRHVVYFSVKNLYNYLLKIGFQDITVRIEDGHYGARKIPVIRAQGRNIIKKDKIDNIDFRNTNISLVKDMLSIASIKSLFRRFLK